MDGLETGWPGRLLLAAAVLASPGASFAQTGTLTDDAFTSTTSSTADQSNVGGRGPSLVVSGNHRAVRFYERAGLRIERIVDGLEYYGQRMGVTFAADAGAVDMVLMRRQVS